LKDKLRNLFKPANENDHSEGPPKRTKYLIIIAVIGLLLIVLGNVFTSKKESVDEPKMTLPPDDQATETASKEKNTSTADVSELEDSYEEHLEGMLNKIKGVSEAEVMVNLDSTNVKVYEKNLIKGQQTTDESDKNGGTRKVEDHTEETQAVLVRQGDQEVPLLIQTKKPSVRGVFVVAKGVDHATVQMWVIEAVSKVLDVPTHKVSVMPKN